MKSLTNLSWLEAKRGDWELAKDLYERALELKLHNFDEVATTIDTKADLAAVLINLSPNDVCCKYYQ
jgi:Tfp pilus assembly protein PilF